MPLNKRAKRHHEIDILVAVGVPYMRAVPAFQKNRAGRIDRSPPRRRVHPFDQGLLGSLEQFPRAVGLSS